MGKLKGTVRLIYVEQRENRDCVGELENESEEVPLVGTNSYIIDAEHPAETARLMQQHWLFTRSTGGLLPGLTDLADFSHVLDIGCGPGGWVLDVAYEYPHIQVTGIDISQTLVRYALAQAGVQNLDNASFSTMDARQPLRFADSSFDLVHARFLASFLYRTSWPQLFAECLRIISSGGRIYLTECEVVYSNNSALLQLCNLLYAALQRTGRSFSPDGRSFGIAPQLRGLLDNAGFQHIRVTPYLIDFSAGTEMQHNWCENMIVAFQLLEPFLTADQQALAHEEYESIFWEAVTNMYAKDFCAVLFGLAATGEKL